MEWLRWIDPNLQTRLGRVRHVLFDFDGTLSTLRQGWETVMRPVMIEAICGPGGERPEIAAEVDEYIDRSTGILTILQMEWLSQAVARHGLNGPALTPRAYKAIYLERLMVSVSQRIERLDSGQANPLDYSMRGGLEFVARLAQRGLTLSLASGTDHDSVVSEAGALGFLPYFGQRVYGALDESEDHAKDRVIRAILDDYRHDGSHANDQADGLAVIGDGSVEMREAAAAGAIPIGLASDEVARQGWNEHKVARLTRAGAGILIADFTHAQELVELLSGKGD